MSGTADAAPTRSTASSGRSLLARDALNRPSPVGPDRRGARNQRSGALGHDLLSRWIKTEGHLTRAQFRHRLSLVCGRSLANNITNRPAGAGCARSTRSSPGSGRSLTPGQPAAQAARACFLGPTRRRIQGSSRACALQMHLSRPCARLALAADPGSRGLTVGRAGPRSRRSAAFRSRYSRERYGPTGPAVDAHRSGRPVVG